MDLNLEHVASPFRAPLLMLGPISVTAHGFEVLSPIERVPLLGLSRESPSRGLSRTGQVRVIQV